MTLKEAILKADQEGNGRMLARIMDNLRFGHYRTTEGRRLLCNYEETKAFFVRVGVNPERFETLCQLADDTE